MSALTARALVAASLACAALVAAPAVLAQTEIKIPIKVNIDTLRGKYTQEFGDELAKATHNSTRPRSTRAASSTTAARRPRRCSSATCR